MGRFSDITRAVKRFFFPEKVPVYIQQQHSHSSVFRYVIYFYPDTLEIKLISEGKLTDDPYAIINQMICVKYELERVVQMHQYEDSDYVLKQVMARIKLLLSEGMYLTEFKVN